MLLLGHQGMLRPAEILAVKVDDLRLWMNGPMIVGFKVRLLWYKNRNATPRPGWW